MYDDWEMATHNGDGAIRAGAISAAIRAADDANWELDEALNEGLDFNEPFDPYADDEA